MTIQTRKIVKIDEDKCDGCGLCVPDCAEGAIQIIDGKARLLAENLCDGLGNCLGACPKDAIIIEERPADDFDEQAVEVRLRQIAENAPAAAVAHAAKEDELPCGCPGTMMRKFAQADKADQPAPAAATTPRRSQLGQWPVQLTLLPIASDIWQDADVLIAADCVSFAMADFHERMLAGKTLAIACPKLDDTQPYVAKLARIFSENNIKSITVARMEVPCCGIDYIVQEALAQAGATIPVNVVIVSVTGEIQSVNGFAVAQ